MIFAKLMNGVPVLCPKCGVSDGKKHTNLPRFYEKHPEKALDDGFIELVEADRPDGTVVPVYTVEDNKIMKRWKTVELPTPEPDVFATLPERVDMLEECLLEVSEIVYA